MDLGDGVGAIEVPALAGLARLETRALQHRAHRPVEEGAARAEIRSRRVVRAAVVMTRDATSRRGPAAPARLRA